MNFQFAIELYRLISNIYKLYMKKIILKFVIYSIAFAKPDTNLYVVRERTRIKNSSKRVFLESNRKYAKSLKYLISFIASRNPRVYSYDLGFVIRLIAFFKQKQCR